MPFFRAKTSDHQTELTVSNGTIIRVLALVLVSILFLAVLKQAGHALVLLFTAFFLALSLNAPVHWIAQHLPGKRRGSRALATSLSVALVLLLLAGFLASIIPPIVKQSSTLIDTAPSFVRNLRNKDSDIGKLVQRYHLQSQLDDLSKEVSSHAKSAGKVAASTVADIGSSAIALLTIIVLTFMMLVEGPRWVRLAQEVTPPRNRDRINRLGTAMYNVVKGYVNGQVLLAAIASLLIFPMLIILHIDYPFALIAVIFICGLIPMVGHTIGAIIVTAVALLHSPISAIIILGYYILYQQIENYTVQPRIQASSTNMSPLLVFAAVVLGASLGGLLGGLVAIPIMGCVRILVLEYLTSRNILRDREYKAQLASAETK